MTEQFAVPNQGKFVQVTVRFPSHYYFRKSDWDEFTYSGQVGKPDRSVPAGSFLLLCNGDKKMPTRVIAMSYVTKLIYNDGTAAKKAQAQSLTKSWQVAGSKGNVYTVTESNGRKTCSCPGFTFRKTCKHVA